MKNKTLLNSLDKPKNSSEKKDYSMDKGVDVGAKILWVKME